MIKEAIVKFLKGCQFNISRGEIYFSTTNDKFIEFEQEHGIDFLALWALYSEVDKDKLMQECFMVR